VQIRGSTVYVTGASRGIGRALALRLAGVGASVGLVARGAAELDDLASELRRCAGPGSVATAVADVGDRSALERAMDELREALGVADALVNNAGIGAYAAVLEEDPDAFDRLMRVNYLGTVHATLAVLPDMVQRRRGHVVNVASVAGRLGAPFEAAYSASKFAVVGFTESLAAEVGQLGVKVSLVETGPVHTSFTDARGVPFQRERPRPLRAETVVDGILGVLEHDRAEVLLPRWFRLPVAVRALLPAAYFRGLLRDARAESQALGRRIEHPATESSDPRTSTPEPTAGDSTPGGRS
jgi:short-subunit dehydrogenase